MKRKLNSWYKIKRYPHIGVPATHHTKTISYITKPEKIARHGFMPFIHKVISTRRYRKEYYPDGKVKNNGKRVNKGIKKRDIHYANHLDSNIYAYYAYLLQNRYESILEKKELVDVVTAYRKIPLKINHNNNSNKAITKKKNNINFADDVFRYIKQQAASCDIVAITFDIKNFFPSLNHNILKSKWCDILQVDSLPDDHYNVFKNITKYAYVEEKHLFDLFKDKIIVKNNNGSAPYKHKQVKRIEHLYNKNAVAYCNKEDIHIIRKKGLIKANKYINQENSTNKMLRDVGICQGSAISATLANIYMLDFDEVIHKEISRLGGIYCRYSDDMVVICPLEFKNEVIQLFYDNINNIKLEIHQDKTQVFHFTQSNQRLICKQEFGGKITQYSINRNFEYLGFNFDGENVYLKTASLAKYYRKMKIGVRRCSFDSNTINNDTKGEIFKKRLYKKYSYIGAKRCVKYKRVQGTKNQWQPDRHTINWGNYITYAKNAHKTMKDYSKINSQIKNHWKNLYKEIYRK